MDNHTTARLGRTITHAEIIILVLLILVWLCTWHLIHQGHQSHLDRMLALQETLITCSAQDEAWPIADTFHRLSIADGRFKAPESPELADQDPEHVLAMEEHGAALLQALHTSARGTDWSRAHRMEPRRWISWERQNDQIVIVMSHENELLDLGGFTGYRRLLLVCAGLASALLLLSLIWAISWLRLSAVKGLLSGDDEVS